MPVSQTIQSENVLQFHPKLFNCSKVLKTNISQLQITVLKKLSIYLLNEHTIQMIGKSPGKLLTQVTKPLLLLLDCVKHIMSLKKQNQNAKILKEVTFLRVSGQDSPSAKRCDLKDQMERC